MIAALPGIFAAERRRTSSFSPLNLPNLVVWLDPSNSSSVTTGTGGVSQINDLSGTGNHFAQSSSGNRPDYSSTLNGLNVMSFVAGNNDNLVCVQSTSWGPSLTMASVAQFSGSVTTNGILALDDTGSHRVTQHRWAGATVPSTVSFVGGTATNTNGSGAPNVVTQQQCFVSVLDNTAHSVTNYINGTQNGQTTGLGTLNTSTLAPQLGRATIGGSNFWVGAIAEIVVCNGALGTTDRQSLEAYLKAKWGTP